MKKYISLYLLLILNAFLILPATANAQNDPLTTWLNTAQCVPSFAGDPFCTNAIHADETLKKLYNAIYSQGAVITLLDEPLSSEDLITVLKVCGYKKPLDTSNQVVIAGCNDYYVKTCPTSTQDDKISNKIQPTIDGDVSDYKYFSCQTKQVIIAASGTGLIQKYLKLIYNFITGLAGVIAVVVIMFNGIKITVSGSDESSVEEAKKQITNSLLALSVLFLSGFILYIINPNFFTS